MEQQAKTETPKTIARTAHTQREYETIYLTKPDLTTEQLDKVKERLRGIVEREGGRVVKFTTWGKKKTSFPVAKQARAIYVHVNYLGEGRAVAEVERNLRNLEEVTKFQTVKVSDAVVPDTRPTEQDVTLEGDREEERPPREAREGGAPEVPEAAAEPEAPEAAEPAEPAEAPAAAAVEEKE